MKPFTRHWPCVLGMLLSTAAWAQTPAPVTNDLVVASFDGHLARLNGVSAVTVYDVPLRSGAVYVVKGPDGAVYVSTLNEGVSRVDLETGTSSLFASGGGLARATGVAFGPDGNLYVGSSVTNSVIRYDGSTGSPIGTFVASGSGGLSGTEALLFGPDGNLYVTEIGSGRVLRYDGSTGAFLGVFATDPRLQLAREMIFADDSLYVAGAGSNNVVRLDGRTGAFRNVFASGIDGPHGLAFGPDGNLYVALLNNSKISRFDGTSGAFLSDFVSVPFPLGLMFDVRAITTLAGSTPGFCGDGGPATQACLDAPIGVALDASSNLLVADLVNGRIRSVDATTGIITTLAGNGTPGFCGDGDTAINACLNGPAGVAVDGDGNLLIADSANNRIRMVEAATGIITTVAGSAAGGFCGDDGLATDACLNEPVGVAVDGDGNLFIADVGNSRIRQVRAASGLMVTVAGSATAGFCGDGGLATSACLNRPTGVAVDADGNLLIADRSNHRVRSVNAITGRISTQAGKGTAGFCGDGGPATRGCLTNPSAVAVDPLSGSTVIADQGNHRVRGS